MVFETRIAANEAEQAAIAGLKEAIASSDVPKQSSGPQLDDELSLLRFVRGYSLDVKDAAKAFDDMLQYRKAHSIDAAREAMYAAAAEGDELAWPAALPKFAPLVECTGAGLMRRIGKSAGGMPATLCLLHLYDVRKVIKAGLQPLLIELQQHQDEWWGVTLLTTSRTDGSLHARMDVVGAHDLGLFHFGISEARCLMKVLEGAKHYPESSARIVSVGNGKALLGMYNAVIKPFMPAHTKEKILVLGREIEKTAARDAIGFDDPTFAKLLEMTGRTTGAPASAEPAEIS